MPGRAAGLRAKDSVAAATALPCARPHTAEAIAMENPAVMAIQWVSPPASPCAKAGMAKHRADRVMNKYFKVRMVCFSSYQFSASGWLTPYRAGALTLADTKSKSVLLCNRAGDINDRQQHEHISLQNCDHNVQSAEDNRHADRNHGKEYERDQIAGKYVGPQTHRQRKQTREVAHQLNRKHQHRQQNLRNQRHTFHRRSEEMQEVLDAGVLESLSVVVQERANGATQRHHGHSGWRFETRNQPYEITDQNKNKQNGEKRSVGFAVVPDDLPALVEDEAFDCSEGMLQAVRRIDR